ncbi:hypothetical protein [Kingella potus]|uniref:hypothetical protein n=1 Tax=Kingella potus TaxID=265175 RepID=UPI001FD1A630|nr:hypothetical protein [Kingella potus]UOP01137.1 hypothetical protein LVJ84_02075 [Kingella potus]
MNKKGAIIQGYAPCGARIAPGMQEEGPSEIRNARSDGLCRYNAAFSAPCPPP